MNTRHFPVHCQSVSVLFFTVNKNISYKYSYEVDCYVPDALGFVLLGDVMPGMVVFGVPGLAILCCPALELVSPVGNKPTTDTIPPEVGVDGVDPLGGKLIENTPGVVGVTTFTGLAPGVVGVVGVVTPGVSTPATVRTVSVEGFFIALIVCRICKTLAHRSRPIPPNSFSYCSGESGGRRILSNTPGQCFYREKKIAVQKSAFANFLGQVA